LSLWTRNMKFKLENELQATLERVEELMFSEKYYEYLMKNHSGVDTIEVVEQTMDADRVRREVKYTPKPIIRKVGPKEIPREALEFTERSTYDRRRHILEFENVPRVGLVRKYLTNKGTMTFVQRGSMTSRTVEGELKVKFPILGAVAERIIYSQARKILEEEVDCFRKYIKISQGG
jgi:pantoate kinase